MNENQVRLGLRFDWKVTLLVLVLLPVTISLGQWQLRRADEKTALLAERAAHQAMAPVALNQLPSEQSQLRYRRVQLVGSFDAGHCFLLDNQVHQGRVGYEIICPFLDQSSADQSTAAHAVVMVSRGFLAAPPLRSQLPAIPAAAAPISIHGEVYLPAGEQVLLADLQAADGWPKVVQAASVDYLKSLLGTTPDNVPVYPWVVRLDVDSPALLESHWQTVNLSPEKHTGYAVQWFAMAATLVLIGIIANTTFMQWFKAKRNKT
jgi:cytochrome oxidase assembly protein ShyY1